MVGSEAVLHAIGSVAYLFLLFIDKLCQPDGQMGIPREALEHELHSALQGLHLWFLRPQHCCKPIGAADYLGVRVHRKCQEVSPRAVTLAQLHAQNRCLSFSMLNFILYVMGYFARITQAHWCTLNGSVQDNYTQLLGAVRVANLSVAQQ